MNKIFRPLTTFVAAILVVSLAGCSTIREELNGQYSTTDLSDYGNYTGNYDNGSVQNYINSFFPEEISDTFEDVTYSYRAEKGDTYAYEAYLEFTINDPEEYASLVKQYAAGRPSKPFAYDTAFVEYTINDKFLPCTHFEENGEVKQITGYIEKPIHSDNVVKCHIEAATIGKILCNSKEQRVIFVAIGVLDGGAVDTEFLSVYFTRFNIKPWNYKT